MCAEKKYGAAMGSLESSKHTCKKIGFLDCLRFFCSSDVCVFLFDDEYISTRQIFHWPERNELWLSKFHTQPRVLDFCCRVRTNSAERWILGLRPLYILISVQSSPSVISFQMSMPGSKEGWFLDFMVRGCVILKAASQWLIPCGRASEGNTRCLICFSYFIVNHPLQSFNCRFTANSIPLCNKGLPQ